MRDVREDSGHVRRIAFLLWLFAFFVCLAFLGFIVRHYIDDLIAGFPEARLKTPLSDRARRPHARPSNTSGGTTSAPMCEKAHESGVS